jgi:hypothetical protein
LVSVIAYTAGALRRLTMRGRARRAQHRAHMRGRLLRWSFARLGATFIKVGQIMSSRPDLFSAGVIAELRWLQDRVPAFPFSTVRAIIERELGAPLERSFRELDPTSVAAGSVAQVHRAVLCNGDEVAVKVLRPEVLTRVRRDGTSCYGSLILAHGLRACASGDRRRHTRDLVAGILAQTDLRREKNNYERFRRNFAGTPGLAFPRVYPKFSTRWILTMEFIHGKRVDEAHADHLPAAACVIRSMFFTMCFDHGFMHADLHPGNVLITPVGGVVILDVGLVKRIPKTLLRQVVDFTRCLVSGDARDLVARTAIPPLPRRDRLGRGGGRRVGVHRRHSQEGDPGARAERDRRRSVCARAQAQDPTIAGDDAGAAGHGDERRHGQAARSDSRHRQRAREAPRGAVRTASAPRAGLAIPVEASAAVATVLPPGRARAFSAVGAIAARLSQQLDAVCTERCCVTRGRGTCSRSCPDGID